MKKMNELAKEYRLPMQSTQEDLESRWATVLKYGNKILLAGYWYSQDGKSWISAVYDFMEDNKTEVDDIIVIREISGDRFEDAGHAIKWAIECASR